MIRPSTALSIVFAAASLAIATGSCAAKDESEAVSPCVAFPKPGTPSLKIDDTYKTNRKSPIVRIASGAGRTYALDRDGLLGRSDADAAATIPANGVDFAVGKDAAGVVRAFVARWMSPTAGGPTTFQLVRFTSPNGGLTFDAATEKVILSVPGGRAAPGEGTSLAFGSEGRLYVALGDTEPATPTPTTFLGKILRLDVSMDAPTPEVWAAGVHQPRGLDFDPETGDLWLTDYSMKDDATRLHRITHGAGDELMPAIALDAVDKRAAFAGGHVYRGKLMPALVGRYVYPAGGGMLVVVDRFGPSGQPQVVKLAVGVDGPIGRNDANELIVAPAAGGVSRVIDAAPPSVTPTSLLATKCWDPAGAAGLPVGGIAYDVTTPLWSDGAAKERYVVIPQGLKITARADGDLVFPVGTVAVKTFAIDGKRIETRLLIQHEQETWVGYSYAWNNDGSDAELVTGNRVAPLPLGKSWYFPSSADCGACHTPAAGYTLGLEAKQLLDRGEALGRFEDKLSAPIDHAAIGKLVPVDAPAPATTEQRARSYLHANCSMCHREGSATGTAVILDMRVDTPLDKTGLCGEPLAGSFGIAKGKARIVAPRDPASSVIVKRMRTLDERRMPKLASSVVDEAGAAAVEAWIRDLAACP